jgi:hypothetical protein
MKPLSIVGFAAFFDLRRPYFLVKSIIDMISWGFFNVWLTYTVLWLLTELADIHGPQPTSAKIRCNQLISQPFDQARGFGSPWLRTFPRRMPVYCKYCIITLFYTAFIEWRSLCLHKPIQFTTSRTVNWGVFPTQVYNFFDHSRYMNIMTSTRTAGMIAESYRFRTNWFVTVVCSWLCSCNQPSTSRECWHPAWTLCFDSCSPDMLCVLKRPPWYSTSKTESCTRVTIAKLATTTEWCQFCVRWCRYNLRSVVKDLNRLRQCTVQTRRIFYNTVLNDSNPEAASGASSALEWDAKSTLHTIRLLLLL